MNKFKFFIITMSFISSLHVLGNDKKQTDKTLFEQTLQKAEKDRDSSHRTYSKNAHEIIASSAYTGLTAYIFTQVRHPVFRITLGLFGSAWGLECIKNVIDRPAAKTRFEQSSSIYRELCKKLEPNTK